MLHPEGEFEKSAIEEVKLVLRILGDKPNLKINDFNTQFFASIDKLTELSRKILERNWQKMNNFSC